MNLFKQSQDPAPSQIMEVKLESQQFPTATVDDSICLYHVSSLQVCILRMNMRSSHESWYSWSRMRCHQVTVEKSFRKTSQTSRTDFIFLFCRLWEDIGMRWRLSWERWEISLGWNLSESKHEGSLLSIELYRFDCWFEFFLKIWNLNPLKTLCFSIKNGWM